MPPDIVVNGRFLSRRVTGVERYGREVLRLMGNNYRLEKTRANGLGGHVWEQFILPSKLDQQSVLWSPANTGPLMIRNQVLTIHDLSPLEHPEWFQTIFSAWYRLFLPMLIKRVKRVIVSSEYTKQKIKKRFGIKDILVAQAGVDANIFHPTAKQSGCGLPEKYILFVGSLEPRKNLASLLHAWNEIKNDFKDTWLIIAGGTAKIFRSAKLATSECVRFLGHIPDDELPGLYANAILFVLPSFDEGFGLPALEAMACGTPVLVSNGGALPEVIGEAGLVFDLNKPWDLSRAMRDLLSDKNLQSSLKNKGLARVETFSWERTADLIWNTLNEN